MTHIDSCWTDFFFVKVDPLSSPLERAAEGHTEIVEKLISAVAVINYIPEQGVRT